MVVGPVTLRQYASVQHREMTCSTKEKKALALADVSPTLQAVGLDSLRALHVREVPTG